MVRTSTKETKPTHTTRPKRPLSAYNLFYRFKRNKILDACACGNGDKKTIHRLLTSPPGLENYIPYVTGILPPDVVGDVRRSNIRADLEHNMHPSESNKKRSHRKTHGTMSFVEMSKIMCDCWKKSDNFTKHVFQEISEEGREQYRQRVAEYKKKCGHVSDHSDGASDDSE